MSRKRKADEASCQREGDKKTKVVADAEQREFAPSDYPNHDLWIPLSRRLLLKYLYDDVIGLIQSYIVALATEAPTTITCLHELSSRSHPDPESIRMSFDPWKREWIVRMPEFFHIFDADSGKTIRRITYQTESDDCDEDALNFCVGRNFIALTQTEESEELELEQDREEKKQNRLYLIDRADGEHVNSIIGIKKTCLERNVAVCSPWTDGGLQNIWLVDDRCWMYTFHPTETDQVVRHADIRYEPPHTRLFYEDPIAVIDPVPNRVAFQSSLDRLTLYVETRDLDELNASNRHVHRVRLRISTLTERNPRLLAVSGDQCFVRTANEDAIIDTVHCFHLVTGKELWKKSLSSGIVCMAVDPLLSRICFLDEELKLFVME